MTVDQMYRASTQLTEAELNALREFWQVCEPRYEELVADIGSDAREHPELGAADSNDAAQTRELLARMGEAVRGVAILIDLVMLALGQSYIGPKERIITEQQAVLRELSTPVLELRPGLLLVPLVGLIESERALLLTPQLLAGIAAYRAKAVVLDITGVPAVDSAVANHLMQTVQATRLMGAHTLISGLSAEHAQTLVRLGLDLATLNTVGTLADGVLQASAILAAAEDRARRFQTIPDVR